MAVPDSPTHVDQLDVFTVIDPGDIRLDQQLHVFQALDPIDQPRGTWPAQQ